MYNPKLIRILKSLSPDEFKDFGKFVHSPFHNESKKLTSLYDSFKKFYPDLDNPLCSKEYFFKCMYENEEYNDDKLRNQLSLMLKLAEEYLSFLEFRKDEVNKKKYLLTQLGRRNLMNVFMQELEHTDIYRDKNFIKDEDYYLNLFLLEKIKRKSFESKTLIGKSRNIYENIRYEIDCLNNFFLISMLKEYFKLNNAERVLNIGFRYKLFDLLLKHIEANFSDYRNVSYINVFFNFFLKFKANRNETSYETLKKLLKLHSEHLSKEDSKNLYIELYNYCKSLQTAENKNFGRESFDLINEMLSKHILFEDDGNIHVQTYINIVASAIRENQLVWAEEFITKYKEKLHSDHRESAYNYNYAVLLYKKGKNEPLNKRRNFETSLNHLSNVKSDDCYYYTRIKNLQLILYYELDSYEPALCLMDTYMHYLSKNKTLPHDINIRYLNFARILHKLINIKLYNNFDELNHLKKDLINNNTVEYHNWLLEKIDELGILANE